VLLIIENVPLARDHRARKQVGALLGAGYDVSVVCRRDRANAAYRKWSGLKIYEYPPPRESSGTLAFLYEYSYSWLASYGLAVRAFAERGFTVIQAGGPPDILFLLALPFKLFGCRFVVDQRDLSPEVYIDRYGKKGGPLLWLLRQLERMSWRSADHVFGVNASLRDRIAGSGTASVSVVGNGPTLASLCARPSRTELKNDKRFLICWLGLMGPQDHVDLALEMVEHFVHFLERKDSQFVFIGDGEARPELERRADELGIRPWTSFTGWLDEGRCFDYLSTADVAIDTNLQEEVSPVKGMEYMGFGVPFAAFDLKETRRMAEGSAVHVPPGDVQALGQAVANLLDDPGRRAVMGKIGRLRVRNHLAWDVQQSAYLRVYQRLVPEVRPLAATRVPAAALSGGET
jgi:glycosyltransferase involved in cell wall biosynthesis